MSVVDPIKVTGLRELQASLKAVEDGLQKQLRVVLNDAAELVAADARRKVPQRTGRAAQSLKAQSGQREAKIVGGSKKVPYYGFLDFGGRVGKNKSVTRPFRRSGRYIYPAYASNRDDVARKIADGLGELIRQAGLGNG